jgi:sterol desaturase/sphingolipid hydroxylase (fatty acid hydroxylase superfamily)
MSLSSFAFAFATQAISYFAVVGLVFLLVWKLGARRFASRRIPARSRLGAAQLRAEVVNTLMSLGVGTSIAAIVAALQAGGVINLPTDLSQTSVPTALSMFLGLLLLNDVWFYAIHRLLHHPRIFRYVHAVHHRSIDVNPFSSYSFHPLEALLLSAWVVPVLWLLPIPLPLLGALQGIGLANNLMSHLGYEFLPRAWVRLPVLRWTNTATFHSLHHTNPSGNFGLMFRFWDRLFGTEVQDYEQRFRA